MPDRAPAKGTAMQGKRGLVMGVTNDRSLGWGIAAACAAQGAEIAFTYQVEALGRRVRPLAATVGSDLLFQCDVGDEASIDAAFGALHERWDTLDFVVHAIAFADKQYLRGRYLDTPRAAFLQALDVSCYSFVAVAQRAVPMMRPGGSLLTLSYVGAERWTPHYNVMGVAKAALDASMRYLASELGPKGIRVNAISAGPVRTLSAAGITGFSAILDHIQNRAPLRRNITSEEVGTRACSWRASCRGGSRGRRCT